MHRHFHVYIAVEMFDGDCNDVGVPPVEGLSDATRQILQRFAGGYCCICRCNYIKFKSMTVSDFRSPEDISRLLQILVLWTPRYTSFIIS